MGGQLSNFKQPMAQTTLKKFEYNVKLYNSIDRSIHQVHQALIG